VTGRVRSVANSYLTSARQFQTLSGWTPRSVRSSMTRRIRSPKSLSSAFLMLTGHGNSSVRSTPVRVRSLLFPLLLSTALTWRVRSSRNHVWSIKDHSIHFRIAMLCERSFLQMIFGLHLSYLVLSSIGVHHT
jgi:hypothetical protein